MGIDRILCVEDDRRAVARAHGIRLGCLDLCGNPNPWVISGRCHGRPAGPYRAQRVERVRGARFDAMLAQSLGVRTDVLRGGEPSDHRGGHIVSRPETSIFQDGTGGLISGSSCRADVPPLKGALRAVMARLVTMLAL